jgi:Smg protein
MKDNLFEILWSLFETSLSQLQKNHEEALTTSSDLIGEESSEQFDDEVIYVKSADQKSMRIFTYEEQMKLTKASYQFLMRMKLLNIIDFELFESIMHQLNNTESRIVTLEETKWTIRKAMENILTEDQLIFLDLVLYQTEDALTKH